ncbi:helix-turn-helix transcriptional regulator [Fibrobacter sp. UWEL]|uniref:helix-turn-helix transcriptional regulator n=1 Tax=Fibrobacter sp. UWEL TaxID=1896209 RepID=UPI00091B5EF5|nr:helix-turn-helix transcriptional regulator [Fibrobacter sp. UWEL]SHL50752.1 transcriptional regulator, y4mF family [Fibrobacter sp. UWEL]
MQVLKATDIATVVKTRRKQLNLTQAQCAAFCGVGNRFFSELENGKDSLHIGKVLNVLQMLGINLHTIEKENDK